jgi:hypothetical protein
MFMEANQAAIEKKNQRYDGSASESNIRWRRTGVAPAASAVRTSEAPGVRRELEAMAVLSAVIP